MRFIYTGQKSSQGYPLFQLANGKGTFGLSLSTIDYFLYSAQQMGLSPEDIAELQRALEEEVHEKE